MLKNNGFHNRHSPVLRFSPLSLFSGGAPGAWYDPSDFTTLFQNSAGTTPVTAVEQPVGLMLDKSQGLVLGPELFTGVIAYNLNSTISIVGNTITATCTVAGQFGFISQSNLVTNGVFAISGNISANPSGKAISVFPNLDGAAVSLGSALISFSLKPFAPAAGGFSANSAFLVNGGIIGDSFSITLASVKKIAGNHAFQATSASRPVLKIDGNNKNYLLFDGSNDSFSTTNINFTSTDRISVFAGVRKLSDAARGMIAELSATSSSNNGTFGMTAPNAASATYAFESKGTSLTDAVGTPFAAPLTSVLSGLSGISTDSNILRINGVQADSDSGDQGTGNYGTYPLYIGRRGGSSLPFNGQLYSLIIVGKAVTAGELSSTETWVNGKTGAY